MTNPAKSKMTTEENIPATPSDRDIAIAVSRYWRYQLRQDRGCPQLLRRDLDTAGSRSSGETGEGD